MTRITSEEYKIAVENGISRETAYQRVHTYKWSKDRAITELIKRELSKEQYAIAAENKISKSVAYRRRHDLGWSVEKAITIPTRPKKPKLETISVKKRVKSTKVKEYAVYRGDELLIIGTIVECAKELNMSEKTIRYYSYPSHLKRITKSQTHGKALVSVLLDDEDDE